MAYAKRILMAHSEDFKQFKMDKEKVEKAYVGSQIARGGPGSGHEGVF